MEIPYIDMQGVNARFEPQLSEAVKRTLASGYYINGPEQQRFERMPHIAAYATVSASVMEWTLSRSS